MGVVSLIVMEPGSAWPGHVGDTENVVAVGPGTEGLLDRTRHVVDSVRVRNERVRVAVLACNDATDGASSGRRAEVAHELLGAVAAAPRGRLVLCATERATTQLRHELMSLAGSLSQSVQGTTVSLRFGDASNDSRSSGPGLRSLSTSVRHPMREFTEQPDRSRPPARAC
jgi:hypothetical protein